MEYYIGVDVGGSKILTILASYDKGLAILGRKKIPTHGEGGVVKRIEDSIESLMDDHRLKPSGISGIGLVIPGPVDAKAGTVIECPNIPELDGSELRGRFETRYGIPVGIDNDAHAAALAEARDGAGKRFKDFVYVCLGTGIGCGIIINGELYKGADGVAGELSHVVWPGLGSFHTLASGKALRDKFAMDAEELESRCCRGDPVGMEALAYLIRYFGVGVGNLVTIINPKAVVIGGGLAKLGDLLLKPLEDEIRKTAFSVGGRNVEILDAEFSTDSGAIGAVYVCLDRIKDGWGHE